MGLDETYVPNLPSFQSFCTKAPITDFEPCRSLMPPATTPPPQTKASTRRLSLVPSIKPEMERDLQTSKLRAMTPKHPILQVWLVLRSRLDPQIRRVITIRVRGLEARPVGAIRDEVQGSQVLLDGPTFIGSRSTEVIKNKLDILETCVGEHLYFVSVISIAKS